MLEVIWWWLCFFQSPRPVDLKYEKRKRKIDVFCLEILFWLCWYILFYFKLFSKSDPCVAYINVYIVLEGEHWEEEEINLWDKSTIVLCRERIWQNPGKNTGSMFLLWRKWTLFCCFYSCFVHVNIYAESEHWYVPWDVCSFVSKFWQADFQCKI